MSSPTSNPWDLSPIPTQATLTITDNGSPGDASLNLPIPTNEVVIPPSPPPVVHPKVDPDFSFNFVFVIFEVEGCLFRVTTYPFLYESDYFAKKFELPALNDPTGAAPTTIVLPTDIRREDFRNLLKALYPTSIATKLSFSESEWISVVKLSTEWRFDNLRKVAILELESLGSLTSLNKVVLGRLCFVSHWLLSGLTEIVKRTEAISNDDATALDYVKFTTLELSRLREMRLQESNQRNIHGWNSPPSPSKATVSSAFAAELLLVKTEEQKFTFILDPPPTPEPSSLPTGSMKKRKKGKY